MLSPLMSLALNFVSSIGWIECHVPSLIKVGSTFLVILSLLQSSRYAFKHRSFPSYADLVPMHTPAARLLQRLEFACGGLLASHPNTFDVPGM